MALQEAASGRFPGVRRHRRLKVHTDVPACITYQASLSVTVLTEIVSGFTQTFQKN